jgi:glutamine synthetase
MAEELGKFADELEKAEDFDATLQKIVCEAFTQHQRIIFNGDGYSDEWKEEAARRGLSNLRTAAEALPHYVSEKNIDLVTRHNIFNESEFRARHEIHLETYKKTLSIEGRTMVDMILHQILPAAMQYSSDLAKSASRKQDVGVYTKTELSLVKRISQCCDDLYEKCEDLHKALKAVPKDNAEAMQYHNSVTIPLMQSARKDADLLEKLTAKSYWPYPTYSDILFY